MFKRISCFALCLVLFWGTFMQQVLAAGPLDEIQSAADSVENSVISEENAAPDQPSLFVDKVLVEDAALFYHQGVAYASLRFACLALRPDAVITWLGDHASVTAEDLHVTVYPSANYVIANDRCLYVPNGVLKEKGVISLPVRLIATIFDAGFVHDTDTQHVYLSKGSGALVPGDEFYDEDDLYWLSHIIYAESGNQPLEGKIAVGNVVLNRVANPLFPNSVYGVIYQKNQFTPASNGTIKLTPNEESVIAAKLCLDGAVVLPTALWFNRANSNSWAAKHKTYITTIGSHAFYV